MSDIKALLLGASTNLINGYKALWNPSDTSQTPFYPSSKQSMRTESPNISNPNTSWEGPNITLCDTPEDILTALYDYQLAKVTGDQYAIDLPSGTLVLDDADRDQVITALKSKLGIDFAQQAGGYALVKINRIAGSASYSPVQKNGFFHTFQNPELVLNSGTGFALTKLAPGTEKTEPWMTGKIVAPGGAQLELTAQDVQTYLDFYSKYGTHYVSNITEGDIIYQIFAYNSTDYQSIKAFYDAHPSQLDGDLAVSFQLYTNPKNGTLGYATQVGNLLIKSSDPVFIQNVQNGDWKDSNLGIDSVFAPFIGNDIDLNSYRLIVPIGFELTEITKYAGYKRRVNSQRIFKSAMFAKYGTLITPNFREVPTYDYQAIFPENIPGFVSTIATPNIDIYKERLDISDIELIAVDEVVNFSLMTQVTQLTGDQAIVIPGDNVTLVAHVYDFTSGNLPVIQLTDTAYQCYQMFCQDFNGPLTIINKSGTSRQVIVDGFKYKIVPNADFPGRNGIELSGSVLNPPSEAVLEEMTTDINFSLTTADIIIHARTNTNVSKGTQLILKYLNWIGFAIPATSTNETLLEFRVRALYLARVVAKLKMEGITVPYLKYDTYQPIVANIQTILQTVQQDISRNQALITARKQAELTIDVGKVLNKNIIDSGKSLSGYISAMAAQQGDLSNFYGQIISQDQDTLNNLEDSLTKLNQGLADQQTAVSQEVEAYKDAVANWETMQIINFSLDVAESVFSAGVTLATPVTSFKALEDLGKMAQEIQKAIEVFKAFNKMYKNIGSLRGAVSTLNNIGYDGSTFPSELDWDEFSVNMQASLDQGPAISAKINLAAAFKILVLRGKALLTTQAQIQQIVSDIYLNQQRQKLSDSQQARLNDLNTNLNPATIPSLDKSKVDLLGLTASYQSVQNQMLAMLARTLVLQDSALQYEYLQDPTPITDFDLLSLYQVILVQSQKIISGLSTISPPPEPFAPLTYRIHGVPVKQLSNGGEYQFMIPLSAKEFYNFAMVRLHKVVTSISNVKSTDSGQYEIALVYNGNPFDDRNQNRQPITYNTQAREFDYLYDAVTGQPKFGINKGTWEDKISNITPFSQWTLSFPVNSINKGIQFKEKTVDITLTLSGEALLRPSALASKNPKGGGFVKGEGKANPFLQFPKRFSGIQTTTPTVLAATADPVPTTTQIVQEMNQAGTVMRGWDVVFNLTESKINSLLKQQWDKRKDDPSFFYEINNFAYFSAVSGTTGNRTITELQLTMGTPLINFLNNNAENVQLTMNIESGNYSFGILSGSAVNNLIKENKIPSKYIPQFQNNAAFLLDQDFSDLLQVLITNNAIIWDSENEKISASDGDALTATVPLDQVTGSVAQKNVILNLAKGAFSNKNMSFAKTNPDIDAGIEQYMSTHSINFVINTIDLTKYATLDSLKPNKFAFNTLVPDNTGASPILQIFIATGSDGLLSNRGINLNDPIAADTDASLMISSKILFADIFVSSFQQGSSGFAVAAVAPPPNSTTAYQGKMTSGMVVGSVPSNGQIRISATSNSIPISLSGMTFVAGSDGNIQASLTQQWTQNFEYYYCTPPAPCSMPICSWNPASLPVTLNIDFPMSVEVTGSGQNQSIQIKASPANININGQLDDAGPCKCNARQVQEELLGQLQSQLPGPISTGVSVNFDSVSLFALKNLLFPQNDAITLTDAYAPGDLIVFGTITTSL